MSDTPSAQLGLRSGELTIEFERLPDRVRLVWLGKCNARDPGKDLRPYLIGQLDAARREAVRLELRFEQLQHFNSSTVGELIHLVHAARERDVELDLFYDARDGWQAISFQVLERAMRSVAAGGGRVARIIAAGT